MSEYRDYLLQLIPSYRHLHLPPLHFATNLHTARPLIPISLLQSIHSALPPQSQIHHRHLQLPLSPRTNKHSQTHHATTAFAQLTARLLAVPTYTDPLCAIPPISIMETTRAYTDAKSTCKCTRHQDDIPEPSLPTPLALTCTLCHIIVQQRLQNPKDPRCISCSTHNPHQPDHAAPCDKCILIALITKRSTRRWWAATIHATTPIISHTPQTPPHTRQQAEGNNDDELPTHHSNKT